MVCLVGWGQDVEFETTLLKTAEWDGRTELHVWVEHSVTWWLRDHSVWLDCRPTSEGVRASLRDGRGLRGRIE